MCLVYSGAPGPPRTLGGQLISDLLQIGKYGAFLFSIRLFWGRPLLGLAIMVALYLLMKGALIIVALKYEAARNQAIDNIILKGTNTSQ